MHYPLALKAFNLASVPLKALPFLTLYATPISRFSHHVPVYYKPGCLTSLVQHNQSIWSLWCSKWASINPPCLKVKRNVCCVMENRGEKNRKKAQISSWVKKLNVKNSQSGKLLQCDDVFLGTFGGPPLFFPISNPLPPVTGETLTTESLEQQQQRQR